MSAKIRKDNAFDFLTRQTFDGTHRMFFGNGEQRDRCSVFSGTARSPDAVNVILGVGRHVEVEDVADGRNVQPACGWSGRLSAVEGSNPSGAAPRAPASPSSPC